MREKRLEALASLDELGAGFTLATHDLEIRGAGELLGEEQSGQIEEVGFSPVHRTARSRGARAEERQGARLRPAPASTKPRVELHVPALIPGRLPARRATRA